MDLIRLTENEKIKIVDIIVDLYPELKKEKGMIINIVLERYDRPNKHIFERIILPNVVDKLYFNNDNIIFDETMNIRGIVIKKSNMNQIFLFGQKTKYMKYLNTNFAFIKKIDL
jgi:hypothetical protein